jgi:hypothetical protein
LERLRDIEIAGGIGCQAERDVERRAGRRSAIARKAGSSIARHGRNDAVRRDAANAVAAACVHDIEVACAVGRQALDFAKLRTCGGSAIAGRAHGSIARHRRDGAVHRDPAHTNGRIDGVDIAHGIGGDWATGREMCTGRWDTILRGTSPAVPRDEGENAVWIDFQHALEAADIDIPGRVGCQAARRDRRIHGRNGREWRATSRYRPGHILLPKPDRTSKPEDRNSSLHVVSPIESG